MDMANFYAQYKSIKPFLQFTPAPCVLPPRELASRARLPRSHSAHSCPRLVCMPFALVVCATSRGQKFGEKEQFQSKKDRLLLDGAPLPARPARLVPACTACMGGSALHAAPGSAGLYECILCACCSTSCPSYWWNSDKCARGRRALRRRSCLDATRIRWQVPGTRRADAGVPLDH